MNAPINAGFEKAIKDMKITKVETIPMEIPLRKPFKASHRPPLEKLPIVIVKITTDTGIVGIGEGSSRQRPGWTETHVSMVNIIRDRCAPVLIGENPFNVEKIMRSLEKVSSGRLYAHCPINEALYDVMARSLGLPVYDLFGGRYRSEIAMSNTHSNGQTADVVEDVMASLKAGYRCIKLKIGADAELDLKNVAAVRKAIGDEIPLAVDANNMYPYQVAVRVFPKMANYDLTWIEQPVPRWDIAGMADLAKRVNVPIAADESVDTVQSAYALAKSEACRIFVTKHHKNGGIYHVKKIWTIAEAAGISLIPEQHGCTGVGLAPALHLCASTAHFGDLPTELEPGPWYHLADDIVKNPIEVKNGNWIVPSGPGLGVELDEQKVKKYRVDI